MEDLVQKFDARKDKNHNMVWSLPEYAETVLRKDGAVYSILFSSKDPQ